MNSDVPSSSLREYKPRLDDSRKEELVARLRDEHKQKHNNTNSSILSTASNSFAVSPSPMLPPPPSHASQSSTSIAQPAVTAWESTTVPTRPGPTERVPQYQPPPPQQKPVYHHPQPYEPQNNVHDITNASENIEDDYIRESRRSHNRLLAQVDNLYFSLCFHYYIPLSHMYL